VAFFVVQIAHDDHIRAIVAFGAVDFVCRIVFVTDFAHPPLPPGDLRVVTVRVVGPFL